MIVKDLIEKLKEYDPLDRIVIKSQTGNLHTVKEICNKSNCGNRVVAICLEKGNKIYL